MLTEIWRIDSQGNIELVAGYVLPPKQALIAFKEQQRKNFNTWTYSADNKDIKQIENGEFAYFEGDVSYFTKTKTLSP